MLHTNGDFFEAVSYSGSHQAGLQAVAKGDVDVAPISDQILASEIANGNVEDGAVKIIHESDAIPRRLWWWQSPWTTRPSRNCRSS